VIFPLCPHNVVVLWCVYVCIHHSICIQMIFFWRWTLIGVVETIKGKRNFFFFSFVSTSTKQIILWSSLINSNSETEKGKPTLTYKVPALVMCLVYTAVVGLFQPLITSVATTHLKVITCAKGDDINWNFIMVMLCSTMYTNHIHIQHLQSMSISMLL